MSPRDPAVKRIIDYFYAAYVRNFNPPSTAEPWLAMTSAQRSRQPKDHMVLPLINGGKEGRLVQKMLATWGENTTQRLIDEYFVRWHTDPRVYRTDGTLGGFWVVAPYLLTHVHSNPRTSANMVAAARAAAPIQKEEPWTSR